MEIDPLETVEQLKEQNASDRSSMRLNMLVAITVATLATFMGVCKVKDDNIVQSMQQAQANKLDHWAFYQARNIRQEIANATIMQLKLSALNKSGNELEAYSAAITQYQQMATEQGQKKEELKAMAAQDQLDYDAANFKDDQFDLSDALIAIAISLLAVTALTRQRWLFGVAMVPTTFGVLMGLSGLCGWGIHPDLFIKMLS